MKLKTILSLALIITGMTSYSQAQTQKRVKTTPITPEKSITTETINSEPEKSNEKTVISKSEPKELADPSQRVIKTSSEKNYAVPTPAKRMGEKEPLSKIDYSLDNNNSTLANLLMLIEIKERVNQEQNEDLLKSDSYSKLNNDISSLRVQFNQYVNSTGLENCSKTEQSHYLAFLKEEGREEEYSKAMSKIK